MDPVKVKPYILTVLVLLFSTKLLATVETDFNRGVVLFKAGDFAAAIIQFKSAQQQGMKSVALHYNLASSYYKLGDYESSRKYFKRVAESDKMKDLAEYNLGLIALKLNDRNKARSYFSSISRLSKEKKLVALSRKKLAEMKKADDRFRIYLSSNFGYDDNITAAPDGSVSGTSDTFYDLFVSADLLIEGERKDGWLIDANFFKIDFIDTNSSDEYQYAAGLSREQKLSGWETGIQLNLINKNFAGDDYQSIVKLNLKGKKFLSKQGRLYLRYRLEDINSEQSRYDYLEGWRQSARVEYRNYGRQNTRQIYYELELNDRDILTTSTDSYDYSPTRHTVRARYTQNLDKNWQLGADLAYRFSDFPSSDSISRHDDQWKLSLSSDYRFDRTFKLISKLQFTDNASTVDRYNYDKTTIRVGVSKMF